MNNEVNNSNNQIDNRKIIGYNQQTGEPIYETTDLNQVSVTPVASNNVGQELNNNEKKPSNNKSTIIFLVLIIIVLLGVVVFMSTKININDKVDNNSQQNSNNSNNEKQEDNNNQEENKNDNIVNKDTYQYVGIAFSGYRIFNWQPGDQKSSSEPDKVSVKIELPKIVISTENSKKFNEKIYNSYASEIEYLSQESPNGITTMDISYDYSVRDDILFISITKSATKIRGTSSTITNAYYYDTKNDKELTLDEICNLFDITIDKVKIKDSSAESINSVIASKIQYPAGNNKNFTVYYKQNNSCPSFGCQDVANVD